ncbi:MAG: hypothetical protein VKM17_02335 [Cyanobacteriota bacterium]|nr:hypothetical protein [Cyanobacteriota bacterium]
MSSRKSPKAVAVQHSTSLAASRSQSASPAVVRVIPPRQGQPNIEIREIGRGCLLPRGGGGHSRAGGRGQSALEASSFGRHSDLDLVVEGLPAAAQLEALGLVEGVVDQSLAHAGQEGIAIDLSRWDDMPSHWQERLRRQAMALN